MLFSLFHHTTLTRMLLAEVTTDYNHPTYTWHFFLLFYLQHLMDKIGERFRPKWTVIVKHSPACRGNQNITVLSILSTWALILLLFIVMLLYCCYVVLSLLFIVHCSFITIHCYYCFFTIQYTAFCSFLLLMSSVTHPYTACWRNDALGRQLVRPTRGVVTAKGSSMIVLIFDIWTLQTSFRQEPSHQWVCFFCWKQPMI